MDRTCVPSWKAELLFSPVVSAQSEPERAYLKQFVLRTQRRTYRIVPRKGLEAFVGKGVVFAATS